MWRGATASQHVKEERTSRRSVGARRSILDTVGETVESESRDETGVEVRGVVAVSWETAKSLAGYPGCRCADD